MIECPNCNKLIVENSKFCEYCGTKIMEKDMYCQNCNLEYGNTDAKFCRECGSELISKINDSDDSKKLIRTIFALEDAIDFVKMTDKWMTATDYANKNNLSVEESTAILERMASKGLIFRRHREQDEYKQSPDK